MKNNIKRILLTALALPVLTFGLFVPAIASANTNADSLTAAGGAASAQGNDQQGTASSLFGDNGQGGVFKTITNVMLFLIGAVSVIMLIIGGVRYVVSGGDSSAVQGAKNTILYAIVGIIVAILAYAVVNFVIASFSGTNA